MAGKTILVVDDSPTELNLMISALDGQGYRLLTAHNGEEALQTAIEEQPDLILLDVILPAKNGFQVCRMLKSTPSTKHIKVILVTSKTQDSDRFWGLRQGADEYVTKPFQPENLIATVANLI